MTSDDHMPIERYYALKSMFERIWGKDTYLDLKHCSDLKVWKRYCERTLRATEIAASDTVQVADEDWHRELCEIIQHGIGRIESAKAFDELFQCFAATYAEISFHQLGFVPSVYPATRSQLRKGNWRLDAFRSVQYVQNAEQKESLIRRRKK
ncbi:hypothetical protein [Roseovarius sp. E0-M6]|uniref:hypothetical protein n=1 Tax=Roseovarius sp. E0-M6 TaxID=3127118 RepID=UPI00301045B7